MLWNTTAGALVMSTAACVFVSVALRIAAQMHRDHRMIADARTKALLVGDTGWRQFIDANTVWEIVNGVRLRVVIYHQKPHLPTMFFMHGSGGNLEQFYEQITFYRGRCTVVAFDLPGHGESEKPRVWSKYRWEKLVDAQVHVFNKYKGKTNIIIAHSYGTNLVIKAHHSFGTDVAGYVLLAPPFKRKPHVPAILFAPTFLINILRAFDRRGALESRSLRRMVCTESASEALLYQQLVWNSLTPSFVVKAMMRQRLHLESRDMACITCPVALLVGENDDLCHADECARMGTALGPRATGPFVLPMCGHQIMLEATHLVTALTNYFFVNKLSLDLRTHRNEPCGEAEAPKACGIDADLKWGLKNFKKWRNTESFGRICKASANSSVGLLPLKVMREDCRHHSPKTFVAANPSISLVIDISAQMPPYVWFDQSFEYAKLKTVSKVCPSHELVMEFIKIVDTHVAAMEAKPETELPVLCGVHCHYGFNRTGFFIISYLVIRGGLAVDAAIDMFKERRAGIGIRHKYFIDELRHRYSK